MGAPVSLLKELPFVYNVFAVAIDWGRPMVGP